MKEHGVRRRKRIDGLGGEFLPGSERIAAQYPTLASLPASGLQQLQSLDSQKWQLVQNHMATLQAGMPAGDYQKFYRFAWGSEGPRIKGGQPGSKPPAGIQQPAAGIQQAPKP